MQTSNRIAWITVIFYFNAFTHFFHSLLVFFSAPINSFHSAILSNFNSALFIWTNLIKYNMQDHNKNCVLYDMQYCLSAIWNWPNVCRWSFKLARRLHPSPQEIREHIEARSRFFFFFHHHPKSFPPKNEQRRSDVHSHVQNERMYRYSHSTRTHMQVVGRWTHNEKGRTNRKFAPTTTSKESKKKKKHSNLPPCLVWFASACEFVGRPIRAHAMGSSHPIIRRPHTRSKNFCWNSSVVPLNLVMSPLFVCFFAAVLRRICFLHLRIAHFRSDTIRRPIH